MFERRLDGEVSLALLEEQHAAELFALLDRHRAYLRKWLPWLDGNTTVEHTAAFIRASLAQFAARDGLACAIVERGAIAGVAGMHRIDWANRRTSIGYWVAADRQGHGLATRATAGLVDYALGELGLNHVEIACAPGNRKSRAVPERLGFVREGVLRQREWLYDHFVDHVVYGITAAEWARRAQRGEGGPNARSSGASAPRERSVRGVARSAQGGGAPLKVPNTTSTRRSGRGRRPSARG
jgi:ribosomal-protein-serine acetyltransferase